MNIEKADMVQSLAGRDQGQYFFVLDVQDEMLLLADGKLRRVESPKRKKRKHVMRVCRAQETLAGRIQSGEKVTNSELRKAIIAVGGHEKQDQEG